MRESRLCQASHTATTILTPDAAARVDSARRHGRPDQRQHPRQDQPGALACAAAPDRMRTRPSASCDVTTSWGFAHTEPVTRHNRRSAAKGVPGLPQSGSPKSPSHKAGPSGPPISRIPSFDRITTWRAAPTRRHSRERRPLHNRHSPEGGNPGEGPHVGGNCFTFTTSPSTGSQQRSPKAGIHRSLRGHAASRTPRETGCLGEDPFRRAPALPVPYHQPLEQLQVLTRANGVRRHDDGILRVVGIVAPADAHLLEPILPV